MTKVRKILLLIEKCKDCPSCYQIGVDTTSCITISSKINNTISSSKPAQLPGYFAGGNTKPTYYSTIDPSNFSHGIPPGTGHCALKKKSVDMYTIPEWCPLEEATKPEIIITKLKLEVNNESDSWSTNETI